MQRLMRENQLNCRAKKAYYSGSTNSKHHLRKYSNLLIEADIQEYPVIVGDVTAFDIKGKNHYCAHLLDLTNREILGISVSRINNTDLVYRTLEQAISKRDDLSKYIHHTDSDVRYCSSKYVKLVEKSQMKISMCRGNAYENAHSESFNKTLKRQEINIHQYNSIEEAEKSILEFAVKYNTIRPHSSLGWISPLKFSKNKLNLIKK